MVSAEAETAPAPEKEDSGALSADFFRKLLGVPACKRGEPCDDCGKCEH